jgi:hypothetical protein
MNAGRDRAAAAIVAVVALLLVVGASARRPLDGGATAPALPAWPLLVIAGAGLVMGAALAAAALARRVRVRGGLPEGGVPVRAGPLTLALCLLVPVAIIAIYASPGTSGPHTTSAPPPQFKTHAPRQPTPDHPGASRGKGAAALAAGIAAGVVGLAAAAVVVRSRRRRREDDAGPRATVAAGARDALAAAAIPADPRAAVLAAYARMEAALSAAGLARRASEAPREYLSRLEASLGGGRAPATRLTGLFERARFSVHPIGEDVRRDALALIGERRDAAMRLWALRRAAMRARLAELGATTATWDGVRPLEAVLEEVTASRRGSRLAARA